MDVQLMKIVCRVMLSLPIALIQRKRKKRFFNPWPTHALALLLGANTSSLLDHTPNAIEGACGWHVAEQGFKRHDPPTSAVTAVGGKRDKFDLFRKGVKGWCCSWMTPGEVKSKEEHSVSKNCESCHNFGQICLVSHFSKDAGLSPLKMVLKKWEVHCVGHNDHPLETDWQPVVCLCLGL
jgi:hypothetical protein